MVQYYDRLRSSDWRKEGFEYSRSNAFTSFLESQDSRADLNKDLRLNLPKHSGDYVSIASTLKSILLAVNPWVP
jgi:hypothetical protein